MSFNLSDSTAIVTGAGRGIGVEIAQSLAEAGADIVTAARTESEIREVADEISREQGVDTLAVPTDLRQVDDIDTLIDETVETFGTPDILINNAGANHTSLPLDQPLEDIDEMLETNMRGLYLLSQRFGEAFRNADRDRGRIVNIASIAAHVGVPAMTLYGGTKSGIYGITQGLAAELAQDGVTVNSVSPGLIEVERTRTVIDEAGEELFDFDRVPLDRIGQPEDIADACLFLVSDYASYITGEDILVDGGVAFTAGLYK